MECVCITFMTRETNTFKPSWVGIDKILCCMMVSSTFDIVSPRIDEYYVVTAVPFFLQYFFHLQMIVTNNRFQAVQSGWVQY
jgi:hypothetical protein